MGSKGFVWFDATCLRRCIDHKSPDTCCRYTRRGQDRGKWILRGGKMKLILVERGGFARKQNLKDNYI